MNPRLLAVAARRGLLGLVFFSLAALAVYGEILARWLSRPEVRLGMATVFLALPFILILSWNQSLKRKVAEQTRALQAELAKHQRTELALRESQKNLDITLNSIGDAVIATDVNGTITRLNPVAESLTQWSSQEACGRLLTEVFRIRNQEFGQELANPVAEVLERGDVVAMGRHTILSARDGTERQIADSAAPIRNPKGEVVGVVLVFHDVTDQNRLEEQFMQAQKMESIGRLAGGVAHDFNNLLSGIIGYAELLKDSLDNHEPNYQYAATITKTANRAVDLTQQLLAFSRKKAKAQSILDLHQTIAEVIGLLARTIDRRIEIKSDLKAEHPLLMGDPSQIQSTLMNLAVNARDAMPEGGQLLFSTRNREIDPPFCRRHGYKIACGPYLEIKVSDTGTGMDKKTLANIFEPFFTTKGEGQGTGLGLAMAYSTVQKHGGALDVDSTPGRGTIFTLYLPSPPQDASLAATDSKPSEKRQGTGRILLVDDEEVVRSIASEFLTKLGYEVNVAVDGNEAVDFYRRHHADIDLVILDLVMPRKNGQDTYLEMQKINPRVKAIIMSGFSPDCELQILETRGVLGFLPKPFTAAAISKRVAECLTRPK